ncbi:hypothetical protein WJX84_007158 [Apatococcus fuscideae]|uniref:Calcineurin-like phosphoesterase domain-containing protein n=1 Tax=Apatococcus fuscideae TaxID=2026836 RepID=A0AAW1SZC1_9CHLO
MPSQQAAQQFQHTNILVYLVSAGALGCIFHDSTRPILERYEINRKWFYLYGATCFFAYLYLRPLIQRQLGSASRGFINYSSVYILWLCGAVFLHLPSFESLGIDFKADVSVFLAVFLLSLSSLAALHGLHSLAAMSKLITPRLLLPDAKHRQMVSVILLNSLSLAVACSTYYSYCGNAAGQKGLSSSANDAKAAICGKWLHPVRSQSHPSFQKWMIYGEGSWSSNRAEVGNSSLSMLNIDIPLDGIGLVGMPAAEAISPVFTLWITLVVMYLVNSAADFSAACTLQASSPAGQRKAPSKSRKQSSHQRHSLDAPQRQHHPEPLLRRNSFDFLARGQHVLPGVKDFIRSVSVDYLPTQMGPLSESIDAILQARGFSYGSFGSRQSKGHHAPGSPPAEPEQQCDWARVPPEEIATPEQTGFLPMFPWYSGTSADMYRTVFDLVISLKLFLGRFDMRTMQAATAASPPGAGGEPPQEGDGFTYEHLAAKHELWLDFAADTGDGGDSTSASSGLSTQDASIDSGIGGWINTAAEPPAPAAPQLIPSHTAHGAHQGMQTLPRADVLILGGDLAYPNPSNETYEKRFFRPFEAAMPPPPHVHPSRLVVNKPDLLPLDSAPATCRCPPSSCPTHADLHHNYHSSGHHCRACLASETLRQYEGPTCFAIPGNHDWIDGLETFQRHIHHKGWLGGWLLPQEASYFALRLPHGWWLLGLDLALVDDIDMCQCRYFARLAEERMGPEDQVILVTHQPRWLMDWFWAKAAAPNLRQLVRGHLRGRARVHLAGDLHFYMRHSFQPSPPVEAPAQTPTSASSQAAAQAGKATAAEDFPGGPPVGASLRNQRTFSLASFGSLDLRGAPSQALSVASSQVDEADPPPSSLNGDSLGADAASTSGNLHPFDPEHLIVNGLGGAFLHPTHVFSASRFASIPDPEVDAQFVENLAPRGRQMGHAHMGAQHGSSPFQTEPRGRSPVGARSTTDSKRGSSPTGSSPRGRSPTRGSATFPGEVGAGHLEGGGARCPGGGGEFRCAAAYPSPEQSTRLGRQNLHLFRLKNTRFDVIGGAFYFLLVVSVLPQCTPVGAILEAATLGQAVYLFVHAVLQTALTIFTDSYISLAALLLLFFICFSLARSGGVGAIPPHMVPPKAENIWMSLAVRARSGGLATQLIFSSIHAAVHVTIALTLMLLLELGVETCVRYAGVGKDGYHGLYRWYTAFEAQHFPDPMAVRDKISHWTLHVYPGMLQTAMTVFDLPEAIAVSRSTICSAAGFAGLTRLQDLVGSGGSLC